MTDAHKIESSLPALKPHHQQALDALIQRYQADPTCLALVLVGSIATGKQTDASDIDFVAVVTDDQFASLKAARQVHALLPDLCDYPGGYAEGKAVNLAFLRAATEHGSEPARWAFTGARIAFSHIPELAKILAAIPVYPRAEKAEKIARFYAQLKIWQGYLEYAENHANPYILLHASARVALFAGRLILAHNEILYPYHKWFLATVQAAPQQPAEFMGLLNAFLQRPTAQGAEGLRVSLDRFLDLERHAAPWISRFVMDSEWNWLDGPPPVEDA